MILKSISGGEKTLAAIVFVLALQKLKPHHLEVGKVRTIRNQSFITGAVMNIDLKTDETGAYV